VKCIYKVISNEWYVGHFITVGFRERNPPVRSWTNIRCMSIL